MIPVTSSQVKKLRTKL